MLGFIRRVVRKMSQRMIVRGKRLSIHDYKKKGYKYDSLHLGCGDVHIKGFCNVDALATPATDIIADITKLEDFEASSATLIYACHVLEHFSHEEICPILRRWYEVLKPGGELRISVPDIDKIVKIYSANWQHFQTRGNSPWIGLIYGGQKDTYDFHKTGFNQAWLSYLLTSCGFEDPKEYPIAPHFVPGVFDASLLTEPFGEYFALNVVARKPGRPG